MSIIGTIYEDITTDVIGIIGSWQWMVTFMTMACVIAPTLNQNKEAILIDPPRAIECAVENTEDVLNSSLCHITLKNATTDVRCTKWRIKFLGMFWMKRSFLVYCEQRIKVLSISVISRLGSVFGCVIFGVISDSFGRKQSMKIGVFADLGFRIILVFCDSESWFHLLIFLRSLFSSANTFMGVVLILPYKLSPFYLIQFDITSTSPTNIAVLYSPMTIVTISYLRIIIVCEIASNIYRTQLTAFVSASRIVATLCLVPIANVASNTETFDFIICIMTMFQAILLRWLPESPHWLLYNRKIPQAEKLLTKAAKRNGTLLGSVFQIRPVNHEAYTILDEYRGCISMLTKYNTRIITITITVFWGLFFFIWSSLYIRVYCRKEQYMFLKLIIMLVLITLVNICLSKKLTLKRLMLMNLIIIACLETTLIITRQLQFRYSIISLTSPLALSSGVIVYALLMNVTPRLLAINIRATLSGVCHSSGHLTTMICYIIVYMDVVDDVTIMITNVALAIVLACLCHLLPDVDDRELPDVMEDMDYFSELTKPLRWVAQKTNSPSQEEIEMRVHSFGSAGHNLSTYSHSVERVPARRIGLLHLRRFMFRLNKLCYK